MQQPTTADRSPAVLADGDAGYRAARIGLVTLSLASFGALTTEMLPVGLLPQIAASLGIAEEHAGLLVGVYALMVAVLAVPLTVLTRRLPRKPLLLATLIGYAVSNVLAATASGFAVLALARGLGGIAHALFFSISIGYAARLAPASHTGKAMALMSVGGSAGFVLGVPLGTVIGTAWGWRASFAILTVGVLVIAAVAWRVLPEVSVPPVQQRRVRRDPRPLIVVILACGLAFLGHYTAYTYISSLLQSAGVHQDWIGPVLLGFGVVGLIGLRIGARHLDERPLGSVRLIPALLASGLLVVAVSYPALVPVLIGVTLWTGAFGSIPSLFQALAVRAGVASADVAGAWINSVANVGIAGGAVVGGFVLSHAGIGWLPVVAAVLLLAVGVIALLAPAAFRGSGSPAAN